jgi:excinuclease UvrABC ATPase subunit
VEGGHVIFQGTPEGLAAHGRGITSSYLRAALNGSHSRGEAAS